MTVHISTLLTLPGAGKYQVDEINESRAGQLIAQAIDDGTASLHIMHRSAADVIEAISDRRIPSQFLRLATQSRWALTNGDLLVAMRLTNDGAQRVKDKLSLRPEHYNFFTVAKIG